MVKFILIKSPDEWATTKQACRDELVVYLFFSPIYILLYFHVLSTVLRTSSLHFIHIYIYIQLDIALWCKNQIEHSIWYESLLFSNCARSIEYSNSGRTELSHLGEARGGF